MSSATRARRTSRPTGKSKARPPAGDLARIQCQRPRGTPEPSEDSSNGRRSRRPRSRSSGRAVRVRRQDRARVVGRRVPRLAVPHGILARLAELDLLRYVEVLSCVSGGSIIGAHFYLELRHLLQTTQNDQITQDHYLELVARIEEQFLAGVQTNIRMRSPPETATAWANASSAAFSQDQTARRAVRMLGCTRGRPRACRTDEPRWLNALFTRATAAARSARDLEACVHPRSENWKLALRYRSSSSTLRP